MIIRNDILDADRTRNRKRIGRRKPYQKRTAVWSDDGTRLLAVIEGDHITPDDIEAARALALHPSSTPGGQ